MSADQAPNTKRVPVPFEVPREPDAYRATAHFGQRLGQRVPPEIRSRVVEELIKSGWVRSTTDPGYDQGEGDVFQFFAFEKVIEGTEWRLVVGIVPEAYRDEETKHLAVTIMEVYDG